MTRIIEGVFDFQRKVFGQKKGLFEQLSEGQRPQALFITCADSRINPNLLTQTEPGELFVVRNAGNFVAPYGSPRNGEAAAVEYAVHQLKVRDIIICGHSQCGAMQGLLMPSALAEMPIVSDWLQLAGPSVERARARHPNAPNNELLNSVIEQNVVVQIENLQTYPVVRDAAAEGRLRLHAWVYKFETGEVVAYDTSSSSFMPLPSAKQKLIMPVPPDKSEAEKSDAEKSEAEKTGS